MTEPRPTLSLGLVARAGLTDVGAEHPMWEAIATEVPEWTPERWGPDERARQRWPPPDAAAGELRYASGDTRLRIDPREPGPLSTHGAVHVAAGLEVEDPEGPSRLLRRLAVMLDADFGHVQVVTGEDAGALFDVFVASDGIVRATYAPWQLRFFLPGAYWGTILGPAYVELFGAERIATVPAHVVERLDDGHFYLQLTPRLDDTRRSPDEVRAARERVMEHLGRDAFWQPGYGRPIMRRGQPVRPPGRAPTFADLAPAS